MRLVSCGYVERHYSHHPFAALTGVHRGTTSFFVIFARSVVDFALTIIHHKVPKDHKEGSHPYPVAASVGNAPRPCWKNKGSASIKPDKVKLEDRPFSPNFRFLRILLSAPSLLVVATFVGIRFG
jgi:hypothetical protein